MEQLIFPKHYKIVFDCTENDSVGQTTKSLSVSKNHKLENTVRTIYDINFEIENNVIKINFIGNGFLHNMVRIIVAMLIEVGNGRFSIEYLQEAMENKNRKYAPKLAPSNGLYLMEVTY